MLAGLPALAAAVLALASGSAPLRAAPPAAPEMGLLSLAASVQPSTVAPGGTVTYTIVLTNNGDGSNHIRITDTLPGGFAYVPNSIRLSVDGVVTPYYEPVVTGQSYSWGMRPFPGARTGNIYGMHTFVQDACNKTGQQLDWSRTLSGSGGYVKELFYNIDNGASAPSQCMIDFVNGAYDRGLHPILRLQGPFGSGSWLKPQANSPGVYTASANAFKNVVAGLPRRDGFTLYIELWNEPNLNNEWGGACNPTEYAQWFKQTADAIHGLNDGRIQVMNGGLSPGYTSGNCDYLDFINGMAGVADVFKVIDVWATHLYPGNHPPQYNLHNNTAPWSSNTIDSYRNELARLQANGRWGLRVIATEGGHDLGNGAFSWEGYPFIDETNRADYISRAFRDYWANWTEIHGITPFELSDPNGGWQGWNWIEPGGSHHAQYDAVTALSKPPGTVASKITYQFQATVPQTPGTYRTNITARSLDGSTASLANAAPVTVSGPAPTPTPRRVLIPAVGNGASTFGPATGTPEAPGRAPSPERPIPRLPVPFITVSPDGWPRAVAAEAARRIIVYTEPGAIALRIVGNDLLTVLQERRAPVAGEIRALVVDARQGEVIASDATNGRVLFFSATDLQPRGEVAGLDRPSGLAVAGNTLAVAETGAGNVALVDLAARRITRRVPVGYGPYAVVYNPTNARFYVGVPGESSVAVLTESGEIKAVIERGGLTLVQGLAVNPKTNRVYAVYAVGGRFHAIAEIDGATNRVVRRLGGDYAQPLAQAYGIAVDAARDRLYVSDRGGLLEIDLAAQTFVRLPGDAPAGYAFGLAAYGQEGVLAGGTLRGAAATMRAP